MSLHTKIRELRLRDRLSQEELAQRVGVRDKVVMTGGVAQNTGVVKALEEELGHIIYTSPLTQYNGALGAALFAYQKYQKEHRD